EPTRPCANRIKPDAVGRRTTIDRLRATGGARKDLGLADLSRSCKDPNYYRIFSRTTCMLWLGYTREAAKIRRRRQGRSVLGVGAPGPV
ncbi:unnamed protein product, partial [Ectocarpus fasciculatus]